MSFNFEQCKSVTKSVDEIYTELTRLRKLRAKHESLSRTLQSWKLGLDQNTSQLDILDGTAKILNSRHRFVTDLLESKKHDPALLGRLQQEIRTMERQVGIWIRELTEVSVDRKRVEMDHCLKFTQQKRGLQRSMTNVELAKMDADVLDQKHRQAWRQFLAKEQKTAISSDQQ